MFLLVILKPVLGTQIKFLVKNMQKDFSKKVASNDFVFMSGVHDRKKTM